MVMVFTNPAEVITKQLQNQAVVIIAKQTPPQPRLMTEAFTIEQGQGPLYCFMISPSEQPCSDVSFPLLA